MLPICLNQSLLLQRQSSRAGSTGGSFINDSDPGAASQILPRVAVLLLMSLLIVETVVGNSLVICSVAKFRRLRSQKCFHLLASLATADIAIAVVVMTSSTAYVFLRCWPFGDLFCKFFQSCDIMCCTASILHLCLISVDRYIAVNMPLQYRRIVQPRRVAVSVAAVWTVSIGLSFGPVYSDLFRPAASNATADSAAAAAAGTTPQCRMEVNRVYAVVSASTSFFLPLIVMTLAYARVHRIATNQVEIIRAQGAVVSRQIRHETKATKTLGLILGCFYVCWLPFFVMYVVCPFTSDNCNSLSKWQEDLITWIGYLNSGLNPILYCFNQREFRCAFQQLLGFRVGAASGYLRSERHSNSASYSVAMRDAWTVNSVPLVPRRARSRAARKDKLATSAAAASAATATAAAEYDCCQSENATFFGECPR